MADGDSKGFWKLIKGGSNVRVPITTSVEGVTGEPNIANLWRIHCKDSFNTADDGCRAANYAVCNDVYNDIQVSYNEVSSAIDYLDINKSCGLDVSCPRTTIDQLRLPVWSAKLLKSIYLDTCPNQFGFKRNHSTDQCIHVLKEIIDAYRVLTGSVFTCFFRCEQGI